MKKFFVLIFLLYVNISYGQRYKQDYGQPIVVLYETDPWLMVIGSDVPCFALYENGQIIYRKVVDKRYKYFQVKNDREKTQSIIKSFGITDSLMKLPSSIEASSATDQPSNILILNFDTVRQISVYGALQYPDSRQKTPQVFLTVYDNILKFSDPAAVEWLPDSIEVMATRYSHSPETPLPWDSQWGDINSPTTVKRNDDLYSIFIDKKYFNDLIKLNKSLKEKQGIKISGEIYSLSYRLPFPNLR